MEFSEEEKILISMLNIVDTYIDGTKVTKVIFSMEDAKVLYDLIRRLQKEIERIKSLDIYKLTEEWETGQLIHKDKIKEKQKELEEQKEKLKYDGNRCFADYEQFCKNLKFFNEQIDKLLEEK